jgi:metal-responsive CopG/Arc/MetJ family transcriptional regulator
MATEDGGPSQTVHIGLPGEVLAEVDKTARVEGRARANLLVKLVREALEARRAALLRKPNK